MYPSPWANSVTSAAWKLCHSSCRSFGSNPNSFLSSMITTSQVSIKIYQKKRKSCLFYSIFMISSCPDVQNVWYLRYYPIHQDSLRPESAGSLLPVAVALLLGRASATTSPGFPSWVSRKDRMSEAEGLSLRTINTWHVLILSSNISEDVII